MSMRLHQTPVNLALQRAARGAKAIPWAIDFLDDAFLGIVETDLILLGAWTGVGKTQIASHLARQAAKSSKNIVFFALEAEEGEIEDRLLWEAVSREWWNRNPQGKPNVDMRYVAWRNGLLHEELFEIEQAVLPLVRLDLDGLRTVYKNENKSHFTVDDFVKQFEAAKEEADLIIVDHMHYFDFDDENENRALKNAAKKIRAAALLHKKPVLLLAHLRKAARQGQTMLPDIDDFYGHSDLVKIGVNVILAARADEKKLKSGNRATWFYIPKARHAGDAQGYAAIVGFDVTKGSYTPNYQLYRARRWEEPELIAKDELPRWAKRAVNPAPAKTLPPTEQERLF